MLASLGIALGMFVIISFVDIVIAVMYARFYSNAAFIVTFGVGGILAAFFSFGHLIDKTPINEQDKWGGAKPKDRLGIIMVLAVTGLLFFFPLARLEGGEYESAFKAYGATLFLSSLVLYKV